MSKASEWVDCQPDDCYIDAGAWFMVSNAGYVLINHALPGGARCTHILSEPGGALKLRDWLTETFED